MATKDRGLEANIPDRENNVQKTGKEKIVLTKLHVSSRPALGELGNRIHLLEQNVKKTMTQMGPAENFVKPIKPYKEPENLLKEAASKKKVERKADKPIVEKPVPKSHVGFIKKQESIVKMPPASATSLEPTKIDEPSSFSTQHFAIVDPDESSKDDPQMVVEYIGDIFKYLMELEDKCSIREKFLTDHSTTPRMRSILVNWLVEVHLNFKLCLETLYMSVSLVDRYLQDNKDVGRETLQLVGTSALLVASKYEEMYIPELRDFVYICDDTFTSQQILDMETDILKKLQFNLGRPLPIHFLRRFSKIGRVKSDHHTLAKYLLELALLEYDMCHVKPSLQAAAALCLSVAILQEVKDPSAVWSQTLVHYTTYKYSDFKSVVVSFARILDKAEITKHQVIRKKYSTAAYAKISLNRKLNGPLVRKLLLNPST